MKEALCPLVEREIYYVEFEARMLRIGKDPSLYKWELEQLLEKADATLGPEAKSALLSRQFMRGLPSTIRGKLLEHNPTPTLTEMLGFVQRYRAVEDRKPGSINASTAAQDTATNIDRLVGLVTELATRQKSLEEQVTTSQQLYATAMEQPDRQPPIITCFRGRKQGHVAQDRSNVQCYQCNRCGHVGREGGNYQPLKLRGASQGITSL